MGQVSHPLRVGSKIPLNLTLGSGQTDKFVTVSLFNQDTGQLIQDEIVLSHVALGYYRNNDIIMPPVRNVIAVAEIYESDQVTPIAGNIRSVDLFHLAIDCPVRPLEILIQDVKPLEIDLAVCKVKKGAC
jgi:hypothetical protein